MEYQRLLENHKAIFKDRQIVSVKKYPRCLKKIRSYLVDVIVNQCFSCIFNKAHYFQYGRKCPKFAIDFYWPIMFDLFLLPILSKLVKKTVYLNNACLYILQTNKKWETSSDIEDITEQQKRKSPILYDYLKNAFEKIKDAPQDLVKRALYEFIILTSASDRNGMEVSITAISFSPSICRQYHTYSYSLK